METSILSYHNQEEVKSALLDTEYDRQRAVVYDMFKPELINNISHWVCRSKEFTAWGKTPVHAVDNFCRLFRGHPQYDIEDMDLSTVGSIERHKIIMSAMGGK